MQANSSISFTVFLYSLQSNSKGTVIIQRFPNSPEGHPYGAISVTGSSIISFRAHETSIFNDTSSSYSNYLPHDAISGDLDPLMLVAPCLLDLYSPELYHETGGIEVLVADEHPSDEDLEALAYKYDKPLEEFFY